MISWFKKHFIPHQGNDHRPHLLRNKNTRNIVFLVIFLEIFTFLIPTITHINKNGGGASVLPAILSDLTNNERQSQKINTLTVNPLLNKAAEMKAQDMATYGYFAHTSPSGKTPWYWILEVGYNYQYAGENLAINFVDSKDVTSAWMNSPTHKANIVKENYTEIGTGIATGIYEGRETIFVAQVYANPVNKQPIKISDISKNENAKADIENDIKPTVLGAETKEELPNTLADNNEPIEETITPNLINEVNTALETKSEDKTNPTFLQKAFASPRNTASSIISIIFILISISLILNIFIKIEHHHPDLITNGLIVLAVIGAIFVINYYLSIKDMKTLETIDYSIETTRLK